ncbi:MAG: HAMP domain-containing histidine kinase [Chlamydiae bacterium]|nr:HAMP domain-containing histidine kinase [Chlamydiota bacterium]MBI3265432.1 HAMP domain-containing histidine kinase [Chlamydiota bacterium]
MHICTKWKLAFLGLVLSFGSPLGWLLIQCYSQGIDGFPQSLLDQWDVSEPLYLYLTFGTSFFFSAFGYFVGHLLEQIIEKDRLLEIKTQDYMRIVGLVAHELKTPLTSVKGRLDLTLGGHYGVLGDALKNALLKAVIACEQINQMISSYLNLSRIERGELDVHLKKLNLLKEVIEPVTEEMRGILENDQMTSQIQKNFRGDCMMSGDIQWLKVIFRNLLMNAVRYGLSHTVIEIRLSESFEKWRVEVLNQGCGVPEEYREKIFGRFEKVPRSEKMAEAGSGLGLYIVKQIIEQHKGDIHCESEIGKWANFIVSFPKIVL